MGSVIDSFRSGVTCWT